MYVCADGMVYILIRYTHIFVVANEVILYFLRINKKYISPIKYIYLSTCTSTILCSKKKIYI